MKKELFSKTLLDALDNATKPVPPKEVIGRMEEFALANMPQQQSRFTRSTFIGIAASLLLLVSANLFMIMSNPDTPVANEQTQEEYNLIPAKSIYNE